MSLNREELIYMSKIAEQTERFEDMLSHMKKVVQMNQELSIEDRNLLSIAYKNSVGSRRTAWRAISSIEQKEEAKGSKNLQLLREYKKKIESELNDYCNDILNLIDKNLIPTASNSESKVFYQKMKGDYYRYVSEYAQGDDLTKSSENAANAYKEATDVANADLKTTHPIRLGLALNYSVFYYEVLNDPSKACNLAKQAFDDAIADIEHIEEDQYKDATTIMQLIRDNLTLWTSEMNDEAEGEDDQNN
uniref:14-3-3 protein n=1 Tax=Cryptocaryon irritans TaxID=153251 RepID=T1WP50_9CILI|nr:14-3-3 protein [Cryptocaryon irritans]